MSEQRVELESRAAGPSEDEATQCRSLLLDAELGTWRAKFLVSSEICTPTLSDRACYPPRGYQCIYQDALEAGLRIPPHQFIVSLLNFFQLGLGQIVSNAWRLVVLFLVLAL